MMAKIPTISQQMFGGINSKLDSIRENMNKEIQERAVEHMERKKEALNL